MIMQHRRGLYAITTPTTDTRALLDWTHAVIDGGAAWLQYRDKTVDHGLRTEQAQAVASACRAHRVVFIVNDDIGLAARSGADGVHLGEADAAVAEARSVLGPGAIIGVSCYDDGVRAASMAAAGADYLAFGAFFDSATKPGARRAAIGVLAEARRWGRPLVAIGGITPDNGRDLVRAGADLLAVVGGLAGPPDQARMLARRYAKLFPASP